MWSLRWAEEETAPCAYPSSPAAVSRLRQGDRNPNMDPS